MAAEAIVGLQNIDRIVLDLWGSSALLRVVSADQKFSSDLTAEN
jgi:hypothetical protein